MITQALFNFFQPIKSNIAKMAKKGLQASFKWIYALFCSISIKNVIFGQQPKNGSKYCRIGRNSIYDAVPDYQINCQTAASVTCGGHADGLTYPFATRSPPSGSWLPLYLWSVHESTFRIVLCLKTRRKEQKKTKNAWQKSEDHDVEPAFCSSLAIFFPGFWQEPNPMTPLN